MFFARYNSLKVARTPHITFVTVHWSGLPRQTPNSTVVFFHKYKRKSHSKRSDLTAGSASLTCSMLRLNFHIFYIHYMKWNISSLKRLFIYTFSTWLRLLCHELLHQCSVAWRLSVSWHCGSPGCFDRCLELIYNFGMYVLIFLMIIE